MTTRAQFAGIALAAAISLVWLPVRADTPDPQPANNFREASLAGYRQHLVELSAVVEACAKARDKKACAPALVGENDRVLLANPQERRLVRYSWLRELLLQAQTKDEIPEGAQDNKGNKSQNNQEGSPADKAKQKAGGGVAEVPAKESTRPRKPTTSELLQAAQARLTQDIAQADSLAAGPPTAAAEHAQERETMRQVLSGRDFRSLEPPGRRDSILEKLSDWLNRILEGLGKLHANSEWVGRVIVWGFILATCVGLVWGLLQLERNWRIRLVPESDGPAAGAASARDWQLWLADARRAAAAGEWREAIHFVYWAAISRLESKRLWPADRARTPREYLALVTAEDPRRAGLATLTGSFERTWYGGRTAGENDYAQAEKLADELINGSGGAEGGGR